MTIYASTSAVLNPRKLWDVLDAYRSAGLGAVELGACDLDAVDGLAARLLRQDLELIVHNYFPPPPDPFVLNLASADAATLQRSRRFVLRALELASAIGAPQYSVHSGFITDPVGFDGTSYVHEAPRSDRERERAMTRFVESLGAALDRAGELGVRLLIENSVFTETLRGKLLLEEPDELPPLFEQLAPRGLGLLVDTGHLNVTATTVGFARDLFFERVAPYVRAFHLHENDGLSDDHLPVSEGSWVLETLRRPEFAGLPLSVEAKLETAADVAAHVAWLRAQLEL